MSANVMTDALKRAGRAPTRETLVRAFEEKRHLDLGGYVIERRRPSIAPASWSTS